MANILKRKCAKCKCEIEIHKNNISNVVHFQDKYYHLECFEELATQRANSKRGKPEQWQDALSNIYVLEVETKRMLEHSWARDDLNEWLLNNYNITMIPNRFWQIITDLEMGKYKGKICRPVDVAVLYGCWQWGQHKLNEINRYNKQNHKGPTDDNGRLMYDLSIVISKIPNYLSHEAKIKARESTNNVKKETKINYNNLETKTSASGVDDISALLDEVF